MQVGLGSLAEVFERSRRMRRRRLKTSKQRSPFLAENSVNLIKPCVNSREERELS